MICQKTINHLKMSRLEKKRKIMDDVSTQDSTTILTEAADSPMPRTKRSSRTKKHAIKSSSSGKQSHKNNTNVETATEAAISTKPSSNVATKKKKKSSTNEAKAHPAPLSTSSTSSNSLLSHSQIKDLKKIVADAYGYVLQKIDLSYLDELYRQVPTLINTWDRIGFTHETKSERLEKFYVAITERGDDLVDCEEELEEKIEHEIDSHKQNIKKLCFELQIPYTEV